MIDTNPDKLIFFDLLDYKGSENVGGKSAIGLLETFHFEGLYYRLRLNHFSKAIAKQKSLKTSLVKGIFFILICLKLSEYDIAYSICRIY